MFNSDAEVRGFTLGDLPLVQRLKSRGISLDSEMYLSRGLRTLSDAASFRLSMQSVGMPSLVVRHGKEHVFGQFRLKPESRSAHIVFVTPSLTLGCSAQQEAAWLTMLDALTQSAGEHGAYHLNAEVDANGIVYETLRHSGFASYARQDLWRRAPTEQIGPSERRCNLRWANKYDLPMFRFLYAQVVPKLVQQTDPAPESGGLILMREGKAAAYLNISIGERGVYIKPTLHMDDAGLWDDVIYTALAMMKQPTKLPVYCCLRQYQTWMSSTLEDHGFQPWARQTVMVKHTTVRTKHPVFSPLPAVRGVTAHHGES